MAGNGGRRLPRRGRPLRPPGAGRRASWPATGRSGSSLRRISTLDAVLVPWGGGGLVTGIASALGAGSSARGHACYPRRAPRSSRRSTRASRGRSSTAPSSSTARAPKALLPGMWELARPLLDGAFAVSLARRAAAVRLLAERVRVVAEGAGALALAAALAGRAGGQGRLHRLGREHRRRPAGRNPGRPDAGLAAASPPSGPHRADPPRLDQRPLTSTSAIFLKKKKKSRPPSSRYRSARSQEYARCSKRDGHSVERPGAAAP